MGLAVRGNGLTLYKAPYAGLRLSYASLLGRPDTRLLLYCAAIWMPR